MKNVEPRCHACKHFDCAGGKDCFKIGEETLALYREDREILRAIRASARVEARIVGDMLSVKFKVTSVCCKCGAVPKRSLRLPRVRTGEDESMCNPVGQAKLMNRASVELNIVLGLCVGHDALFNRHAEAYVTTFVAKDRVLAHNPVGAVYSPYVNRRLREGLFAPND